jgi:ABC-type uncharacterized transport system ATPase subunit
MTNPNDYSPEDLHSLVEHSDPVFREISAGLEGITVEDLEKRIDRWLDFFELQDARGTLCRDLSKGMRQKILISAALLHDIGKISVDLSELNHPGKLNEEQKNLFKLLLQ